MNARLTQWLKLDQHQSEIERNRAWRLGLVLLVLVASNSANVVLYGGLILLSVLPIAPVTFIGVLGVLAISGVAWALLCRGRMELAAHLTAVGLLVSTLANLSPYSVNSGVSVLLLLAVLFVALFARRFIVWLYTASSILYIVLSTRAERVGELTPAIGPEHTQLLSPIVLTITCLAVVVVLWALITNLDRTTQRVERRLALAGLVNKASERLASALDIQWLFNQVADMFFDTYDQLDFLRIYIIEENTIRLAASTDANEMERLTSPLQIGDPHRVGLVAASGQAVLLSDITQADLRRENDLIVGARALLVLPMMIGGVVSGVLELQSLRLNAWTNEEVQVLQTLANLVAAAAEKTRLLEKATQRTDVYKQEMAEMQARLERVGQMDAERIAQTWLAYLQEASTGQSLVMNLEDQSTTHDAKWTAGLRTAVTQRDVVSLEDGPRSVVGVPIWSGGLVVGAMEFELEDKPSAEQIEMARQVGERLGLAADNTRLFAETQRIASREAMVNEIGANLQAANDIETALVTAAQGLSQVLNVPRVSVRIGLPAQDERQSGGEA